MWKVYHIQSGRIVKAGFESDDQAKEWLERRKDLPDDEHDIDEMDEEEEEEFLENADDDEAEGDYEPDSEGADDVREISYPDDDLGGGDDDEDDDDDDVDGDDDDDDHHDDDEDDDSGDEDEDEDY